MTPKFAISLIIVSFLLIGTSTGQINTRSNDVSEKLKRIHVDSFVIFSPPQVSLTRFFDGLGQVDMLQFSYVFYQKDGQSFAKQILEYCNADCSMMKTAVSHPLKLDSQDLFAFISSKVESIKFEEIRHYTYKVTDTLTGEDYYEIAGSYHTTYHIQVLLGTKKFEKSVNMFDFEKLVSKGYSPNLNYEYNNKTQLKWLVDILLKFTDSFQNQFKF